MLRSSVKRLIRWWRSGSLPVRGRILRSRRIHCRRNQQIFVGRGEERFERSRSYGTAFKKSGSLSSCVSIRRQLDHMDHVNEGDISQLAKSNTVCTLLPGANYFLGLNDIERAAVDRWRRASRSGDRLQSRHLAHSQHANGNVAGCTHMKMSPRKLWQRPQSTERGLCASATGKGSIEPGKDAISPCLTSRLPRDSIWFGGNHCAVTWLNGVVASRA